MNEDIGGEPEEVADGIGLKSPSIAITPGDIIHIVWEREGEILVLTKNSLGSILKYEF
ncbi:MAG: hypothetical protein ABIL00_07240 [candidate division WOR-3 bacterium]